MHDTYHFPRLASPSFMSKFTAEFIATNLEKSKSAGRDQWVACCPSHADSTPSLSISEGKEGKVLFHCHGGCTQDEVLIALQRLNLWPDGMESIESNRPRLPKGIPPVWPFSSIIKKEGKIPGPDNQKAFKALYTYRSLDGMSVNGYVVRYEGHGKKDPIPFFKRDGEKWKSGYGRSENRPLYGQEHLKQAEKHERPQTLCIVEGEKCCDWINNQCGLENGLYAVSSPGGSSVTRKADWRPIVELDEIILMPDFDFPGYKAMADIATNVRAIGFEGNIYLFDIEKLLGKKPEEGFDVADLDSSFSYDDIQQYITLVEPKEIRALADSLFKPQKKISGVRSSGNCDAEQGGVDPEPINAATAEQPKKKKFSSGGFEHSDYGNAKRFAHLHGKNLRYCADAGWFVWDGKIWERDIEGKCNVLAMSLGDEIAKDADNEPEAIQKRIIKFALQSGNIGHIKAVVNIARDLLPFRFADMDKEIFQINCANGLLNLKTQQLTKHRRENNCTKIIDSNYDVAAKCPNWMTFLYQIMLNDQEMVEFLQRAWGYTISGSTKEQKIFMCIGEKGGNGKSVFFEVIKKILGPYAIQSDSDIMTLKKNGEAAAPSNMIARTKGALAIICNELQEDAILNEAKVKELTGQDTVTARYMYKEFFEFITTGAYWTRTNHPPRIKGNDGGIWRRVCMVPFRMSLDESQIDKNLLEKLLLEKDAIFAWMVEGCRMWQEDGLKIPKSVLRETAIYRNDMDVIGEWLSETCEIADMEATIEFDTLYKSYTEWVRAGGEYEVSKKKLALNLRSRGYRRQKIENKIHYLGISLKVFVRDNRVPKTPMNEKLKFDDATEPLKDEDEYHI